MIYMVYAYIFVCSFSAMCGGISVIASYYFIQNVYNRIDKEI